MMKTKKLLLPLLMMTLLCVLCAGVMVGCHKNKGHVHNFSEWAYDDAGHWKICTADDEKTEKEPHTWGTDDKCACGAEKPVYSTASGSVKLLKLGEYITDYTGVDIDPGEDDGIEVNYDSATGEFTVANARVGKTYTLTITNEEGHYLPTSVNLQVVKDQNTALGDCILFYDAFTHGLHVGSDWNDNYGNPSKIDKAHVNDAENPYFSIGEGTGDFYVYSREKYDIVSAAVTYKQGDTFDIDHLNDKNEPAPGNQGLRLVFDDGKAVMIRIEKLSDGSFKAQWVGGDDWGSCWEEKAINLGNWDFGEGEEHFNKFSNALKTKYASEGVELKLIRNGGVVYAYVNGIKAGEQSLPVKYAAQKCRVAIVAGGVIGGAEIPFAISDALPTDWEDSNLTFTPTLPTGVTATLDKTEGYKRGDLVTLTLTGAEEYVVTSLDLGETSLLADYENGKVSFILTEETGHTLTMAISQKVYLENGLANVNVTSKKFGANSNTLENGAEVTLKGLGGLGTVMGTVQGGKLSTGKIAQGVYTVHVPGYKPVQVTVGANGIENGITIEYDSFYAIHPDWGSVNFAEANETVAKLSATNNYQYMLTNDTYGDVEFSVLLGGEGARNGDGSQGIFFRFKGTEINDFVCVRMENKLKVQFAKKNEHMDGNDAVGADFDDLLFFADKAEYAAYLTAYEAGTLKLSVVRKGATFYVFLGDDFIGCRTFDAKYESVPAQVGMYYEALANNTTKTWTVEMGEPRSLASTVNVTVDDDELPEGVTATATADKQGTGAYTLGETVTVTVTLPEGSYIVSALTVNGTSMLNRLNKDGTLTFTAMKAENAVAMKVIEGRSADVEVNVTGKKYDEKGNSLEGKQITLVGQGGLPDVQLTVTDGKIKGNNVQQGTYTATATGYKDVEDVVVGENGIVKPIVFEYDAFELAIGWDSGEQKYDHVNDAQSKIGCDGKTLNVVTKDTYSDVSVSLTVKDANSRNGADQQGIWLKFDDGKYLMLRSATWGGYRLTLVKEVWKEAPTWLSNEINFYYFNTEETQAIQGNDGIELKLVRKGGKAYVFLGGKFVYLYELPAGYAAKEAKVGFWSADSAANAYWDFNITETLPDLASTVNLETSIPNDVQGIAVSMRKGSDTPSDTINGTLGDTITLTITLPESGYSIKAITVNGTSMFGSLQESENTFTLTFGAMLKTNTVSVTVEAITNADVNVAVTGNKFGVTGNSLIGQQITFVGKGGVPDATLTVDNDGKIVGTMPQGIYTATATGYTSVQNVVVGANGIETPIVFEYNSFYSMHSDWGGGINLDNQNASASQLTAMNDCQYFLTNDKYGNVKFSVLIGGEGARDGNGSQGIFFRFEKTRPENDHVICVRMERRTKVQFCHASGNMWDCKNADGVDWQDLIFFDLTGDEYLTAYANGTLKLSVVREGATFYVFLGDDYIGQRTFPGYETASAQVGMFYEGMSGNGARTWTVELTETLPSLTATVTSDTTANGTVTGIPETPVKFGTDDVTLTLTPGNGYVLESLTVGGKDVTPLVTFDKTTLVGTFTFKPWRNQIAVVAEYAQKVTADLDTSISGVEYRQTTPIDLNGNEAKLSNAMAEYTYTIASGKLTLNDVLTGTYTLTMDGYMATTVTVTASGIEGDVKLVKNIFTSAPASAKLSTVDETTGKVTATGNGGVDLETEQKYTVVTAEAHFDVPDYNKRRYGIALVFENGKHLRVDIAVQDNGNNILQETHWNDNSLLNWNTLHTYSQIEIENEFMATGLTYKLERNGASVKIYINDVLMKEYTLSDEYANQKAQLKFIFDSAGTDGTAGFTYTITAPEATPPATGGEETNPEQGSETNPEAGDDTPAGGEETNA